MLGYLLGYSFRSVCAQPEPLLRYQAALKQVINMGITQLKSRSSSKLKSGDSVEITWLRLVVATSPVGRV